MKVEMARRDDGGSITTVHRRDGVVLRLSSYDRTHAIPHDLAHFVAERAFGLRAGIWGCIAAGAVFDSMQVVSGRLRHDRHARSEAVLRRHATAIGRSEVLAGVVHHGAEAGARSIRQELREAWGVLSADPCPVTEAQAVGAVTELQRLGREWAALEPREALHLSWPHEPPDDATTARTGVPRGRRGRL